MNNTEEPKKELPKESPIGITSIITKIGRGIDIILPKEKGFSFQDHRK